MTVLLDHQFEILPSEEAGSGFVFGHGTELFTDEAGFDPGENTWITQDSTNSRRGNTGFGRDVLGAKTWSWESVTDRDDVAGALDTLQRSSAAWMPELLVRQPRAQTAVRYALAGRTRRVYGRPRGYTAPPSNLILNGRVPVTHDFQTVDAYSYDDAESNATILYSSSSSGNGVILPQVMPVVMTMSTSSGNGQVGVGGNARAYPVIRFNGPWINPVLDTGDWVISWTGEIANGNWIEIDCRPWMLTVLDQSGASAVAGLNRKTIFEDCWFAPSANTQIDLGGIATGGTASCQVRWRNTYTSY